MKLTGKFWWQWLWIWHLYKYCGNSQGLRLWDLQAVFIHNNDPHFPSMQYMVTHFENYQSWILGPSQILAYLWRCPLWKEKWHAFAFPGSFALQVCRMYPCLSESIGDLTMSALLSVFLSLLSQITSWVSQMSHIFPNHHSTSPHSSGMLCAQHSRTLLACSSEFFYSPIPVSKLPPWVHVDLMQQL